MNYGETFEEQVQAWDKWRAKHERALTARACMTALYTECYAAVCHAREKGVAMDLREWATSDSVEVTHAGRSARFRHGEGHVLRLVVAGIDGESDRVLTPPDARSAVPEWAAATVNEVLCALLSGKVER